MRKTTFVVYNTIVKRDDLRDDLSNINDPSSKVGGDAPLPNFEWGDLSMIAVL